MSAVEYTQKHWSKFQDEYTEMLTAILPDDTQVEQILSYLAIIFRYISLHKYSRYISLNTVDSE